MVITYDPDSDAAYIALSGGAVGSVSRTVELEGLGDGVFINADIGPDGKITGFEIIGAAQVLPAELLATAERA